MIRSAAGPDSPLLKVGHEILTTSVFAIIVCANIGVSAIHFLAPRWLHRTVPPAVVVRPPPAEGYGSGGGSGCGGRRGGAGEPCGPAAAAARGVSTSDGDGGAASVRHLRVGNAGSNWAEESYSPSPRSIQRSLQEGGAFTAALAGAGGGGREGGSLWCRCGDGGGGAAGAQRVPSGCLTRLAELPVLSLTPPFAADPRVRPCDSFASRVHPPPPAWCPLAPLLAAPLASRFSFGRLDTFSY
jgi:hypothetical protein